MDKSKDKTMIQSNNLEVQYANLLSKSKLMESEFKKEILELRVLYQSEKEKSSSLEQSIKNYPLKVSALENLLSEETSLRKSLESTLEEYSNQQQNGFDQKELERYKRACSQLQAENRSLNQHYINTLNERNEMQKKLTTYIDFLNKKNERLKEDHDKIIEEIKLEESQRRAQENKGLRKEIEYLNTRINNKKEKCSRISQKYEDCRDLQLEIAAEVDKKESAIQYLKRKNEELMKKAGLTHRRTTSNAEEVFSELEQLKAENTQLKNKIQSKKDKFYKKIEEFIKDKNELICKVKGLEQTKNKLEQDSNALNFKIHEQSETIRNLHDKLKDCQEQQNEIAKQTKQSIQPIMIKLKTERDAFKAQLEEVQKSNDLSTGPCLGTSLFEEFSNLKNQTAESLEVELSQVSEEKAELEKELREINSELYRKITIVAELESEIKDLQARQITSDQKYTHEMSEKEKTISVLQKTKAELQENIKKHETEIYEKDKIIKQLEEEKTKLKNEISHLRDIESQLKQKEHTILEIQLQKAELQKEIDLLQQLNSEIIHKDLAIVEISDAETDIRTPTMSTKASFSTKASMESERTTEHLNSELFDKENIILDLNREINELKQEINKLRRENKDLAQSSLQTLCPKYTGRNGIAAILELESERDMLKSEIMRLETQLQLSNQEWNCYSNQLYDELVKEHDQKLKLLEGKQRRSLKQLETSKSSVSKKKSLILTKRN